MFIENYYVNEEKKVVVCKLELCSNALICDMCHKGLPGHADLLLNDTYVGKAVCADEDTFDIEKGKRIAYNRAVTKLANAKKKTLTRFINNYEEMVVFLRDVHNDLTHKYDRVIDRRTQNTEKIINE